MTQDRALSERSWPKPFLVVIALLHVLPFAARPALIGGDEPHYALMAHSIAVGGDIQVDEEYEAVARGSNIAGRKFAGKTLARHVRIWHDRSVFSHPLGLPALAAPFLWLKQQVAPLAPPDLILGVMTLAVTFLALLMALSLMFSSSLGRSGAAAVLALYFSTPLWYYSRTFFTEPYLWAGTVLSVWAVARERWTLAAAFLGVLPLIKETAAITAVVIVVATLWGWGWRRAALLALGPALAALVFCGKNIIVYGDPLVTFQAFQRGDFLQGLVGVLFDPVHGLAPFAPLALVAASCWPCAVTRACAPGFVNFAAVFGVVGWLFLTAAWLDWGGGSCYGPRLMVPMLPALALPLAELWRKAEEQHCLKWVLGVAFTVGFTVQWCAALDPFSAFWSIPITRLLARDPWATGSGLLFGLAGSIALLKWRGEKPAKSERR